MMKQMCCKIWCVAAVAMMSCSAMAAESICELTVSAGSHDRSNTPVSVLLPKLKADGRVALATPVVFRPDLAAVDCPWTFCVGGEIERE